MKLTRTIVKNQGEVTNMKKGNLYTFIMDYLGGTYISQVDAENAEQAMEAWIKTLVVEEVEHFSETDRKKIIRVGFHEDEPGLLTGIKNVWHFTVETKKGFAHIMF